jgi:hypothetical protein
MTDIDKVATARFGFWAALATAVTTLITFIVAILTPPLSGPLCTSGCFRYPYLDIAARFPRDYQWMFLAIVAIMLYLAFMVALSRRARPSGQAMAEFGLLVALMAGLILLGTYYVQLAVVQPSLLARETDGIALLTQYNPHGLFIALEELGYLLMSVSLACVSAGLSRATRAERFVRWLFLAGLGLSLLTFAFFLYRYGHRREYLFEISVIAIDWLVLIAGAFSMTVVFRREVAGARETFRAPGSEGAGIPALAK